MFVRKEFTFPYTDFSDAKQSILKRFGNVRGSNKGEKERTKAKAIIKNANNFTEIERGLVNTTWKISIRGGEVNG